MRGEQIKQLRHKGIVNVVALDNAVLTLIGHLQVRLKPSRVAGQRDRFQVLIGFQQIIHGVTVVQQAVNVSARHNHRIDGQRWRPGKGRRHRQHGAVIGGHFPHAGIKQFRMHALGLQRLHDPQHVAGAGFVVQQDGDHAAFNRATRHGIQAQ